MRRLVGLLACLALGALGCAHANDPAPAAPNPAGNAPPAQPAPASAAPSALTNSATTATGDAMPASHPTTTGQAPADQAPSGHTPAAQATPTSQTTPAAAGPSAAAAAAGAPTTAASHPKADDLTPDEKSLLSQGYRLEMRGTEKHFCRNQAELGTRFTKRVCVTAESVAATRQNSKDYLNDVQRPSGNTPAK